MPFIDRVKFGAKSEKAASHHKQRPKPENIAAGSFGRVPEQQQFIQ
jgi:hypothetical protein